MDTFCPVGPWIVPLQALTPSPTSASDALAVAQNLAIRTVVNGSVRQSSRTRFMLVDICQLIALISANITLTPGDVIATGTPAGVGAGMTPKCFLRPGDVVAVSVQGVGTLTNTVARREN